MKTKLEDFATKVASATFETDVSKLNQENYGVDWENLIKFIEVVAQIVFEIMDRCPAKKSLVQSIKNPTWLQRVRVRAAVKANFDYSGNTKLRTLSGKAADAIFSESAKLTETEIAQVVEEVNSPDNWLI